MIGRLACEDSERRFAHLLIAGVLALLFVMGLVRSAHAQDPTTTGSITATGGTVTVLLANVPAESVQVAGSWSGSIVFEQSVDGGVTWWPATLVSQPDGTPTSSAASNGLFLGQNAGYTHLRVRAVALSSGTIAVTATRGFALTDGSGITRTLATLGPSASVKQQRLLLPCNALRITNCQ